MKLSHRLRSPLLVSKTYINLQCLRLTLLTTTVFQSLRYFFLKYYQSLTGCVYVCLFILALLAIPISLELSNFDNFKESNQVGFAGFLEYELFVSKFHREISRDTPFPRPLLCQYCLTGSQKKY